MRFSPVRKSMSSLKLPSTDMGTETPFAVTAAPDSARPSSVIRCEPVSRFAVGEITVRDGAATTRKTSHATMPAKISRQATMTAARNIRCGAIIDLRLNGWGGMVWDTAGLTNHESITNLRIGWLLVNS